MLLKYSALSEVWMICDMFNCSCTLGPVGPSAVVNIMHMRNCASVRSTLNHDLSTINS